MEQLITKISSYNLFNYLLTGVVFVVFSSEFTTYNLFQENLFLNVILYYFIGLVISRLGSLIIEPVLKKINFVKFAEYSQFIFASKKDPKVEILSESNNMYRTFCSVFLIIIILKIFESLEIKLLITKTISVYLLLVSLFIIFLYSYKKQTNYITKRIINL